MGAKTCMLAFSDGNPARELATMPPLDRPGSAALAAALFPKVKLEPLADGTLWDTYPRADDVLAARLGSTGIAIAHPFALDRPSQLPQPWLRAMGGGGRTVHLHAMHSVVDWFAFAVWQDGVLLRSLSLAPDNGAIEDIGDRLPFERPFWRGEHPAVDPQELEDGDDPYPLPFHPLELGQAALREFFGFVTEGDHRPGAADPGKIPLMRFRRKRSLFSFWK